MSNLQRCIRAACAKEISKRSTLPPPPPYLEPAKKTGTPLQHHSRQTYIIVFWIFCLVIYFVAIELAIRAHELLPDPDSSSASEGSPFGRRGTRRREITVQAFNVGRTILTVAHVPIITATIATTLPMLTQKTKGRKHPPNLSVEQLFLLADRTWAGAGGWCEAIRIGNLSWEWWRLTLLVLVSFAGFPIATLGYLTVSEQYWEPAEMYLPKTLRFNASLESVRSAVTQQMDSWVHSFPQRELGEVKRAMIPLEISHRTGKSLFSFYPPANQAMEKLGHFVTYLEPVSADGQLLVADSMGMVQNILCRSLGAGEGLRLIDMQDDVWSCRGSCHGVDSRMCHSQTTLGARGAQVTSCVRATGGPPDANPVLWEHAVQVNVEIALKINTNGSGTPAAAEAGAGGEGTQAVQCSVSLIPGDGIVDSVIRRFMHFLPYGVGLATDTPELLQMLEGSLPEMLNVTVQPALSLLHLYFSASSHGHGLEDLSDPGNSLPVWFGIQASSSPGGDVVQKITPEGFANAFTALANSTFITALPSFVGRGRKRGFSYQTHVKLQRGFVPAAVAPLVLLMPVLLLAWMSIRGRSVATWTEFLDSFAMFRLGRHWEREMEGCGAEELGDCWQAKQLPGWVGGDAGVVKLGGRDGLEEGVRYG